MGRPKMQKERDRRVARAETAAGIREGHYNLGEKFVRIWIVFYPSQKWCICDCERTGQDIQNTGRTLDEATKAKLTSWLK